MGISHNLPPAPELKVITNCKENLGSLADISTILKGFNKSNQKFFLSLKSFKSFCKRSKLENFAEKIFKIFLKGTSERISVYELLAGIILFSTLTWQQKVSLGFNLFDFNNDGFLNKDELQMLISIYSYSIFTITKIHIEPQDLFLELGKSEEDLVSLNEILAYLSYDNYFISFLNTSQVLPPISKSPTPVKTLKFQMKKLTPILSNKPEHNYIDLPSGKFSKFFAISLKNAFDLIATETEGELKASPMQLAGNVAKISDIENFAPLLEDLAILHESVSFEQIIEILCSDAKEEQIEKIFGWVQEWENGKSKGVRKNKSCTKTLSSFGSEKRKTT